MPRPPPDGRDVWQGDCCGEGVIEAHEDDTYDQEGTRLRPLRRTASSSSAASSAGQEQHSAQADGYGHDDAQAPRQHAGEADALQAPAAAAADA
jgi:hypothetical protein